MSVSNIKFCVNDEMLKFLLDTGASLCAIKSEILDSSIPVHKDSLKVKGIGGNLYSKGYVYLKLHVGNFCFDQKFHVFDNLSCDTDGIIGQNFLRKYGGILNFEKNTLSLVIKGKEVTLNINSNIDDNIIMSIPPRCEIVKYVPVRVNEDCVVVAKELCEGVFMAGVIARPQNGKIPIKILNTRENEVCLKNCMPEIQMLNEYDFCKFKKENISVNQVKKLFELLDMKNLNIEEQISIENICAKFVDIFHLPGDKLTTTNLYKQSIQLKENVTPVYVKPYRVPNALKEEVDKQIKKMCEEGIIEEAKCEWSSPVLLVPKKMDNSGEKKWRIVIDYRLLNQKIQDDKFPLPNITDILDSLSGAMYFSHLDLSQGYYQLELTPESRQVTAFTTNRGQYQMKRLPMGLKTSPSAFSRLMTVAMSGLNYDKCFVYLDDLIVFGRNLEDHNRNLINVFSRLRQVNLKLNPYKCEFLKKEILYLGHIITAQGILPDPDKIKALQKYPIPTTVDEVKRFVAFANYYRKFIPHFADIVNPLNALCRKNARFDWSEKCQNSFIKLRESLIQPPVLQYPNFAEDNEFILQTDASGVAMGAVLSNKNNLPVAYASRSLNKAELNYATIEKELLAIVWAVKHFRPYLFGRRFKIVTDHKPLIYLFSHTNPSSRLTKFRLCLEEYDFHVEYIKGRDNVTADALSRIILTSNDLKDMNKNFINVMTRAQSKNLGSIKIDNQVIENSPAEKSDQPCMLEILKKPKDGIELIVMSKQDMKKVSKLERVTTKSGSICYVPSLSTIFMNLNTRSTLTRDVLLRDLDQICKEMNIPEIYVIKNKYNAQMLQEFASAIGKSSKRTGPRICIIRGAQRIIDNEMKKLILNDFHILPTSGHAGINRMTNNIKKYYFWPGMVKDISNFVKKCSSCQKHKYSRNIKEPMVITTTAKSAFEKLYLDIVGPIDKDNDEFSYILTLQCELTKFVEAYPLKTKDTVTVAKTLVENFILRYGIPREIATDRGSEFISSTMKEVCKLLQIKQLQATAYHHESIGSLENSHKVLGAYLRSLTEKQLSSWSSWLSYWCFSYNTTVHTETKYTPFELVFGKVCNIPNNLLNTVDPVYNFESYPIELKYRLQTANTDARNNLIESKIKRKKEYDKSMNPVNYKEGDLILVKNEVGNKLNELYNGPYIVIKELSPNVLLNKNGKEVIVHKNRTKLYNI